MPIFDQGYQHWNGTLSGHAWRWLAITRRGVRIGMQGRVLRMFLLLSLFAFYHAVGENFAISAAAGNQSAVGAVAAFPYYAALATGSPAISIIIAIAFTLWTIPLITRRSSTRCAPRRPRGISGSIRSHSASESQYSALLIQASAVGKLESQISPFGNPLIGYRP